MKEIWIKIKAWVLSQILTEEALELLTLKDDEKYVIIRAIQTRSKVIEDLKYNDRHYDATNADNDLATLDKVRLLFSTDLYN